MFSGDVLRQEVEDALFKAQELLKIGWCRTWAVNKEGKGVRPESEDACKWCLEGALEAATIQKHGIRKEDGTYEDTEEAKQIRQTAAGLIQMANEKMANAMASRKTAKTGRIHSKSVIPTFNDSFAQSQEQVISWVERARKLASMAKWV